MSTLSFSHRWGVLLALACGSATPGSLPPKQLGSRPSLEFSYLTPKGVEVSTQTLKGRVSVVALISTDDLASQVLVRRLEELRRTYVPRVNVAAVALQPPRDASLVEMYPLVIELSFPVASADSELLGGAGPFGVLEQIPCAVVLDKKGRLVRRLDHDFEMTTLRAAVREAAAD
jgi:hypothetical protein